MKYISIVDFEKNQHYHDRKIILWVKLYTNLLTSYKLSQLSVPEKWLYVVLLMLAPAKENAIPRDLAYLSRISEIFDEKIIQSGIRKMYRLKLISSNKGLSKVYTGSTTREGERDRKDREKEIRNNLNKLSYEKSNFLKNSF